jgi:hypothetical protein
MRSYWTRSISFLSDSCRTKKAAGAVETQSRLNLSRGLAERLRAFLAYKPTTVDE